MTDKQIIEALEFCSSSDLGECKNCPFYEQCENDEQLVKYTLDLIKRQKAEIERLQDRNCKCIYLSDNETTEFCVDSICPKFKTEKTIQDRAINSLAEKLKEYFPSIAKAIDHTVEEMIGK